MTTQNSFNLRQKWKARCTILGHRCQKSKWTHRRFAQVDATRVTEAALSNRNRYVTGKRRKYRAQRPELRISSETSSVFLASGNLWSGKKVFKVLSKNPRYCFREKQEKIGDDMKERSYTSVLQALIVFDDVADNPSLTRLDQLFHAPYLRGKHSFVRTIVST